MTPETLTAIMPNLGLKAGAWAAFLGAACERFDIDTPKRQAAFLAQIAHESRELTRLQENLRYLTESRLREVFGKRLEGRNLSGYVDNPEGLANVVYAGRMGNGVEESGDGWRYRGRGPIQITGRKTYRMAGDGCGWDFETTPDLLLDPRFGALSAAWYWHASGCNTLADADDFEGITRKINGGTNGLEDRVAYWEKAKACLLS